MNEALANNVVARLKQDGQLAVEEIAERLGAKDDRELREALAALVARQTIKLSPRGKYYVPGHVPRATAVRREVRSGEPVLVDFGRQLASGTGFACNGQDFAPGDVLTNRHLMDFFRVGNMRGIRISKTTGAVLVISSVSNALYKDRWQDSVFEYTGEGRYGDQDMTGGNLAIADSPRSGAPLLLFFKRATNAYEFQGEVRLMGEPRAEQQEDEHGLVRRVWVFALAAV